MKLTDLHLRRLGRVNPGWGIRRNRKAVYVMAFGRGVAVRWCARTMPSDHLVWHVYFDPEGLK